MYGFFDHTNFRNSELETLTTGVIQGIELLEVSTWFRLQQLLTSAAVYIYTHTHKYYITSRRGPTTKPA